MNLTTRTIIDRLPGREMITPRDIQEATGMQSTCTILAACRSGEIAATMFGNRIMIAREEAIRWIEKQEERV